MTSLRPPLVAILLGWGGVIPFAVAALAWLLGSPLIRIYALQLGTTYAGVIIVFLGAVHWGFAASRLTRQAPGFIWSVLPALAVTAALTAPPLFRPVLMLTGLLICWGVDVFAFQQGMLPSWYMKLRHGLTAAAGASMAVMAFI